MRIPAQSRMHSGKDRLLAAAESVFAFEGIEAAKIDSIAAEAKVSKNFIYNRFAGKSALYGSIRRNVEMDLYQDLLALDHAACTPEAAIEAYLSKLYDCHVKHPVLISMMRDQLIHGTAISEPDDDCAQALGELRRRITHLLERGRSDGSIGSDWDGSTFLFFSTAIVMGAVSELEMRGSLLYRRAFTAPNQARQAQLVALIFRTLRARGRVILNKSIAAEPVHRSRIRIEQGSVDRILDAAESCFGDRGFDRTTIGQVSAAAGVSLQLVYYYFTSKPDLFTAMTERMARRALPPLLAIDYESADPLEAIGTFLNIWWRQYAEHPTWALLAIDHSLHHGRMRRASSLAPPLNLLLHKLNLALRRDIAQGVFHSSMDAATLCLLGISLIPLAVAVMAPDCRPAGGPKVRHPLHLKPESAVDFILSAAAA